MPKGANGIISGRRLGQAPAGVQGHASRCASAASQADAEITSVGGEVYAKLPLVPGTNKIDPKAFGLPDPATLFSHRSRPHDAAHRDADAEGRGRQVRQGSEVLTTIKGTLPGAAVVDLFLIGDRNGTFQATYGLTDADELRQVALTGPFFGAGTSSTYTLTLDQYGAPVTIDEALSRVPSGGRHALLAAAVGRSRARGG